MASTKNQRQLRDVRDRSGTGSHTSIGFAYRGNRAFPVPAEIAGQEVQRLINRDGACQPSSLVEENRNPDAPLHKVFQWDDDLAAHEHRLNQARRLIGAIRVVVISEVPEERPPAFMSVRISCEDEQPCESSPGYVNFQTAVATEASYDRSVLVEWKRIRALIMRCTWVKEFDPLREAMLQIDATLEYHTEPADLEHAA
jgi:hypothetical protein